VQTNYAYDPYGVVQVAGTASDNSFQFTGRENDGTGLMNYRARYYNPAWGRFISEDPIGLSAGDVNLYRYVANNPVQVNDPSGLFAGPGPTPPPGPSTPFEQIGGKKSPTFRCIECNAPHGGVYGPLCPDCHVKSRKDN
jgi:RHS repeat-associated protein